jgi:dodecin
MRSTTTTAIDVCRCRVDLSPARYPVPDDNRRTTDEGGPMSNHTYRVVEIVGSSPEGIDAAIRNGIVRASQTTRNLDWFEVLEVRGQLAEGGVAHVQVTMKVGFRMEDV